MSTESGKAPPRHYFLNERHQLAPAEKDGGGRTTPVIGVDWSARGTALSSNLDVLRSARKASPDPSARGRLFILAKPAPHLTKESKSQKAQDGKLSEKVDFAGQQSQILRKLGFDLIAVQCDGSAVVHAPEARLDQIEKTLGRLAELGIRERNKWATVSEFTDVPVDYKCSKEWWPDTRPGEAVEAVIDIQPFLPRSEIDAVIRQITSHLGANEKLKRIGTEFTGRRWLMVQIRIETALHLASEFQAICSVHPPLVALASAARPRAQSMSVPSTPINRIENPTALPCVAVMDTGIPNDHVSLAPYCRGRMIGEGLGGGHDPHGSLVASRIVFGDVDCSEGEPELVPQCRFYDVNLYLSNGPGSIAEYAVDNAVATIASNSPDVRVFNISFDGKSPLESFADSYRATVLRRLADLDNRAFAHDILFVIAAGNSPPGVKPTPLYPRNYSDTDWSLRTWSRCFNALTCGGTASEFPVSEGLATEPGAPSPFTRVGPGFAGSRKPDLCGHAGNCDSNYSYPPGSGLGVWCCNEDGLWEDHAGTSFAAPLVARTAARLFAFLQEKCGHDSRPYAALVKAVLALRAKRGDYSTALQPLAKRTLGYGSVDFDKVTTPTDDRAVFLWQGCIENEGDLLTVELPLPGAWVGAARNPVMRLVCAWDTPVNSAIEHVWACRRVEVTLRTSPEADALRPSSNNPLGYPLAEKTYTLANYAAQRIADRDLCLMELSYTHQGMAEYPAGVVDFSPQQRVAVAYELWDDSEEPISPHAHVQSLPVANTLDRLSIATAVRQAISIRTGV